MARCAGGRPSFSWAARATNSGDRAQRFASLAGWRKLASVASIEGRTLDRDAIAPEVRALALCFPNNALELFAGDARRKSDNLNNLNKPESGHGETL
jgi:hypothetical protein